MEIRAPLDLVADFYVPLSVFFDICPRFGEIDLKKISCLAKIFKKFALSYKFWCRNSVVVVRWSILLQTKK